MTTSGSTSTRRAKAGPFGTTVAHGYLTLSLGPALLGEILDVEGPRFAVNYGLNRVTVPGPRAGRFEARLRRQPRVSVDDVRGRPARPP